MYYINFLKFTLLILFSVPYLLFSQEVVTNKNLDIILRTKDSSYNKGIGIKNVNIRLSTLQKDLQSSTKNPGQYKQVLTASSTIIEAGEKIKIKLFISGYGYINPTYCKLFYLPSSNFYENSCLYTSFIVNNDGKIEWGIKDHVLVNGNDSYTMQFDMMDIKPIINFDYVKKMADSLNIESDDLVKAAIKLDSLGLLEDFFKKYVKFDYTLPFTTGENKSKSVLVRNTAESGYIYDLTFNNDPRSMMLNTETQGVSEHDAPFVWEINTKKDLSPGIYELNFLFTYFNGKQWVLDDEKIQIKVMNVFERNDNWIEWLAIFAGVVALFPMFKIIYEQAIELYKLLVKIKKSVCKKIKKAKKFLSKKAKDNT